MKRFHYLVSKRPYYPLLQWLALLLAALLAACEAPAPKPPEAPLEPVVVRPIEPIVIGPGDYTPLLESTEVLLDQGERLHAATLLDFADAGTLTVDEQALYAVLRSRLTIDRGQPAPALAQFEALVPSLNALTPQRRWQVGQWHCQLLRRNGNHLDAARAANRLLALVRDSSQRDQLLVQLWDDLQLSPRSRIEQALAREQSSLWRSWLELNHIAGSGLDSPASQVAGLAAWRSRNPGHPAAETLPGGLDMLASLAEQPPTRVALLLPLNNSLSVASQAVLDGYLAALMAANRAGWPAQQLNVYDMGDFADINAAYQAAVDGGNQLVIGPLSRGELRRWQPAAPPPVPLLSLNRFPQTVLADRNIYQLSLTPTDEARQLAEFAADEGGHRALLIGPAGEWGDSMASALNERWSALNGEIVSRARYTDRNDYSTSLQAALNLEQSEERATGIRRLLASNIEFSPRRRQDLDTVFLLSSRSSEARAIKPLIAYHYADDLPVYATSHVHNASLGAQQNRDLEALRLLEIPWTLESTDPLVASVAEGNPIDSLAAMYALGADAFLLHWRLPQLRENAASLRGHSGLLTLDEQGRFRRTLLRASIREGRPEALDH